MTDSSTPLFDTPTDATQGAQRTARSSTHPPFGIRDAAPCLRNLQSPLRRPGCRPSEARPRMQSAIGTWAISNQPPSRPKRPQQSHKRATSSVRPAPCAASSMRRPHHRPSNRRGHSHLRHMQTQAKRIWQRDPPMPGPGIWPPGFGLSAPQSSKAARRKGRSAASG